MHLLLCVLGQVAAEAAGAAEAAPPVDWLKVLLSFVNFGVLVFILIRFGGPIVRDMLRKRHDTIKNDLEAAAALRGAAESRLREYEQRLANIEHEIAELGAAIKREADAEAQRIIAAAQEAAARMNAEAEFLIHQEVRRIEIELRRDAALHAIELAEKLLSSKMTEADHRRLADQFVREMAGGPGSHGAAPRAPGPASATTPPVES